MTFTKVRDDQRSYNLAFGEMRRPWMQEEPHEPA